MFTLNCRGKLLIAEKALVMGIINTTPDSFYGGSRFMGGDAALQQAEKMLSEGADLLDIGGQSTRPGAAPIGTDEELQRVIPAIAAIHHRFPDARISVDTFRAQVAVEAVAAGACMVNDISAGDADKDMLALVGPMNVPYICMHMQGDPQTMQQKPRYENITLELLDFFSAKKEACARAGIKDLIIDPGFGFGKTIAHNFELLKQLALFRMLDCPVMAGLSRKSSIYKTLGTTADKALNGTTVLNTIALMNGASILRVHDVREAKEAVQLLYALE